MGLGLLSMAEDNTPVRYPSYAFHKAHPDRLSALARLLGLQPGNVDTCRVLDLGCASGGHLLPMAARLPNASFTGLDIEPTEIALGERQRVALGLENLKLIAGDLRDTSLWSGPYDFIIAHGMYTWLPAELQRTLLEGIRDSLAPGGVAYVSWNVLPGWYRRAPIREMVRCFVPSDLSGQEQIRMGRALVDAVGANVPEQPTAWSQMIHEELERLDDAHDGFFLGDVAAPCMEPLRFDTFSQRIQAAGLQVLCDAEALNPSLTGPTHPTVRAAIEAVGQDLTKVECFLDLVEGRPFRASLLVNADEPVNTTLDPEPMERVLYSSDLAPPEQFTPGQPAVFSSPWGGTARINMPIMQVILDALSRKWPERLSIVELETEIGELMGQALPPNFRGEIAMALRLCTGSNLVEVHTRPMPPRKAPSERPVACPVVRQAASSREARVPSDVHRAVPVHELDHVVLARLDGTVSIEAITQIVREHTTEAQRLDLDLPTDANDATRALLQRYARLGLLNG